MNRQKKTLFIGGHRGCLGSYPENTIGSIDEGLLRGADYIEVDIQFTKDDNIILFHDTVIREAGSKDIVISESSMSILKSRIPSLVSLEDVLEYYKEKSVYFAIEVKGSDMLVKDRQYKFAYHLTKMLREFSFLGRCFIFSIDCTFLHEIRGFDKEVDLGVIATELRENPLEYIRTYQAQVYIAYLKNLNQMIVSKLQGEGYFVNGSTVSTKSELLKAFELGVDMVDSDNPDLIRTYMRDII